MAEVINLRQARKKKARAEKETQAEENRTKHGRKKEQKARDLNEVKRAKRELDFKKLDN